MNHFQQVIPNVYTVALPLPFELESVNVHLIKLDNGWMLIDCGMETDEAWQTLEPAIASMGLQWTDIRQILLTHMHPDHMGMSARLLELTGAVLWMHAVEAEHLEIVARGTRRVPWLDTVFSRAGVSMELQSRMERHFLQIRRNFHDLVPNRLFQGGEEIPTAAGSFRVLWTPGHSPGHICLYNEQAKLLISGDQILENITPNVAWHPDADTLGDFLASLEKLRPLEIDIILPSHGTPFSGHREWIANTIAHHGERCDEMLRLVTDAPRSANTLVTEMWRRQLSPINHHFAIFEVLAHLEHMHRQGRVHAQEREADGVWEWMPGQGRGVEHRTVEASRD
ncbi:MAG TPA: MBL fold metallo-hydrolase [Bryobacteraceae bacterium]|nr:MBL fold metallo-hydrolase [Bryobacteraceae bacterium]